MSTIRDYLSSNWYHFLYPRRNYPYSRYSICCLRLFLFVGTPPPPKRVELIIDAFLQMPDQNLMFSYGKNDPMKNKLLEKIQWQKNIFAIEAPSDDLLLWLIRWSLATIYIPVDEDFGMSPVESMACGTPVIWVDEGWLKETIIPGKTGKLLPVESGKLKLESLKQVIQNTKKEEWEGMKNTCISRARDFSLDAFEKKLKSSLHI